VVDINNTKDKTRVHQASLGWVTGVPLHALEGHDRHTISFAGLKEWVHSIRVPNSREGTGEIVNNCEERYA